MALMKTLGVITALSVLIIFGTPGLTNAQSAQDCSEGHLRDLGVAIISCIDTSATSSCGGSLAGNTNAEKAFRFFVAKGYQPFQAAGIIGNMMVESGVMPQRLQGTSIDTITPAESVGDKNIGWGIVQWTPGSKIIRPSFDAGKDPNDLAVQLDFLFNQLEGNPPVPEKTAGDQLKATTTVEQAVLAFQGNKSVGGEYVGFERPKDQTGSVATRTSFAIDALTQFGSGTTIAGNGGGCGLDASGCPTAPISESATVLAAGIRVHPCIAPEVERIMALAREQGLTTFRGDGWVSKETQEKKRENNGCSGRIYDESCKGSPITAIPGESRHERGTAIDFYCDGATIPDHSSVCFKFLESNTKLQNLPEEPWHWSVDGG
jgi:hypothetical protein